MTIRSSPGFRNPRVAAAGLRASGVIGAVGIATLAGMFASFAVGARSTGMALGWVNDVTGIVTLPLALPGMMAVHARLRPVTGRAGDALLALGVGSSAAIVVLQVLLVTNVLTFEEQVGAVSTAYLGLGAWFVITGWLGRRTGTLGYGLGTGVAAALFVGYPIWAFRLAAHLEGAADAADAFTAARTASR